MPLNLFSIHHKGFLYVGLKVCYNEKYGRIVKIYNQNMIKIIFEDNTKISILDRDFDKLTLIKDT